MQISKSEGFAIAGGIGFFMGIALSCITACATTTAPDGTKTVTPPSAAQIAAFEELAAKAAADGLTIAAEIQAIQAAKSKK